MMRAAFHVHSDWSYDGRWSLERISREFHQRGYDSVFLCEHCRTFDVDRWKAYQEACRRVNSGARLFPGIEYSDPANVVHVPTWGLVDFVGSEPPSSLLAESLRGNEEAYAVLAHPARRNAWQVVDEDLLQVVDSVEIWNRKTDGIAPSKVVGPFLARGLQPIAALDFHTDRQRFPFRLEISCDIESAEEDVLDALRAGRHRSLVCGYDCPKVLEGPLAVPVALSEWARRSTMKGFRTISRPLGR